MEMEPDSILWGDSQVYREQILMPVNKLFNQYLLLKSMVCHFKDLALLTTLFIHWL